MSAGRKSWTESKRRRPMNDCRGGRQPDDSECHTAERYNLQGSGATRLLTNTNRDTKSERNQDDHT